MGLQKQLCHICRELHDVVMGSPNSRHVRMCLDCYTALDTQNKKDFGLPEIKRDTGTHDKGK